MSDLSTAHLTLFGAITHFYATAETSIKLALAAVLGAEISDMMIMCEPYTSLNLRNVAKSLVKAREPVPAICEEFLQLVGDFGAFGGVRNNIAHNVWTEGDAPGTIKPVRLDIRDGKAKTLGFEAGEDEFSLNDLAKIADNIAQLNNRLVQFLRKVSPDSSTMAENV